MEVVIDFASSSATAGARTSRTLPLTGLAERRKMMQKWADYCDALEAGADVISFPERAS